MYRKGKDIRKKRHLDAFVFVPSVFGEKLNDIGRNFLLGSRKKIAKCLMRTFTCRSTFLYDVYILRKEGSVVIAGKETGSGIMYTVIEQTVEGQRRKIRLIEGNAKCRHLKKLPYKGTLDI